MNTAADVAVLPRVNRTVEIMLANNHTAWVRSGEQVPADIAASSLQYLITHSLLLDPSPEFMTAAQRENARWKAAVAAQGAAVVATEGVVGQ